MTLVERLYGVGLELARPLLPVAGFVGGRKVARGVAERRGAVARLRAWASEDRPPDRAVLWLHGASAGELTGAVPAIRDLRERTAISLLVTYFSPSAVDALELLEPDGAEVLPLDTSRETGASLEAVRPDLVVFAKHDVWPNLTREAARRGVPMALINGTVRPGSRRLGKLARRFFSAAYARLDRAGASSDEDAERLQRLGVDAEALRVTGDASFDWALERARRASADPSSPAAALRRLTPPGSLVLVAGSTWRPDEELLLNVARRIRPSGRSLFLVLVPHEPDPAAITAVRERCRDRLGEEPLVWSEIVNGGGRAPRGSGGPSGPARGSAPLVVDVTGILAELYGAADLAYVGGGFGDEGLHSVVEPAAAAVPVLFGPRGRRREARRLVDRGGGRRVGPETAAEAVGALMDDPVLRGRMGGEALAVVEEESGAAVRTVDMLLELLA